MDCAPAMRNSLQTERKKKGEFEGYDAFLPSRAQTGIGGLAERLDALG